MKREPTYVGIDVAKDRVDIAVRPTGQSWSASYEEEEVEKLVARLQGLEPAGVILEATGGLELTLVAALAAASLPVAVKLSDKHGEENTVRKIGRHWVPAVIALSVVLLTLSFAACGDSEEAREDVPTATAAGETSAATSPAAIIRAAWEPMATWAAGARTGMATPSRLTVNSHSYPPAGPTPAE